MNDSKSHDQRIAKMSFATVYPLYLAKVEKKGRTKEELHQVITWLTGYDNRKLQELIKEEFPKLKYGYFNPPIERIRGKFEKDFAHH